MISAQEKKAATPKVMRLIDKSTGEMECRVCGSRHFANLRPGGFFYRGSWQCIYGCRLGERESVPPFC
jgi:hypothetical protein